MNDDELLKDWYGGDPYRELSPGERIVESDVFIQEGVIYTATDIGNGVYTADHFAHYRRDAR